MKVLCMVCGQDIEEDETGNIYNSHMTTHRGGQIANIQKKKLIEQNIPKQALPPGVTQNDLPDEEFLKTVQEMEKNPVTNDMRTVAPPLAPLEKKPQEKPQGVSTMSDPPVVEKPIELTYKYTGTCDKGHEIATLETDVANSHFAIGYCVKCDKQIKSREVVDLKGEKTILHVDTWTVKEPPNNPKVSEKRVEHKIIYQDGKEKKCHCLVGKDHEKKIKNFKLNYVGN